MEFCGGDYHLPLESTMSLPAIFAEGIVRHYGTVKALDGLDLEVPEGTVLRLFGPDCRREDDDSPSSHHTAHPRFRARHRRRDRRAD